MRCVWTSQIAELQADVERLANLQQLQDELDADEFLGVLEESELYSVEVGVTCVCSVEVGVTCGVTCRVCSVQDLGNVRRIAFELIAAFENQSLSK